MISKDTYDYMKKEYGLLGSWAIWQPAGNKPKSNIDDMSWENSPKLLDQLNTGYVFVGLNWSGTHGDISDGGRIKWANFHSGYSRGNDYKLRFALTDTKYWGSYITDILKFYEEVDSTKVKKYIKNNPEFVKDNIGTFEKEIRNLGKNLKLIALGGEAYSILVNYLGDKYPIIQIKHFSYTIGKEDYREDVLKTLNGF